MEEFTHQLLCCCQDLLAPFGAGVELGDVLLLCCPGSVADGESIIVHTIVDHHHALGEA